MKFLKSDLTGSQNLVTGALAYTSSSNNRRFKLEGVIVHASVAITETITITRDSKEGSTYDHVLAKRSLISEQDFVFRPYGECNFNAGDEVKLECTNANGTGTVYYTIKRSELP